MLLRFHVSSSSDTRSFAVTVDSGAGSFASDDFRVTRDRNVHGGTVVARLAFYVVLVGLATITISHVTPYSRRVRSYSIIDIIDRWRSVCGVIIACPAAIVRLAWSPCLGLLAYGVGGRPFNTVTPRSRDSAGRRWRRRAEKTMRRHMTRANKVVVSATAVDKRPEANYIKLRILNGSRDV